MTMFFFQQSVGLRVDRQTETPVPIPNKTFLGPDTLINDPVLFLVQ